jgi:hypothetical protein
MTAENPRKNMKKTGVANPGSYKGYADNDFPKTVIDADDVEYSY